MEGVVGVEPRLFGGAFAGRRVLVTGHTGFKGSWLVLWLLRLGAQVTGYALEPDTVPSLYADLGLSSEVDSRIGDIRDADALMRLVIESRPEVVLHLAAQPLVRRSYAEPRYTFEANIMGTVNLLEAVRACSDCRAVVNVTTDKVYANAESGEPFSEDEPLGGRDPYSASKAGSEIVTASYRSSFFETADAAAVATARAGNVIGGGDWAEDRIVPDIVRALTSGEPVVVRNPASIRPWQHVLEPLSGYLHLAASLLGDPGLAGSFNFGPDTGLDHSVGEVADRFVREWGHGSWEVGGASQQPHEAARLQLDIGKAGRELGWQPIWDFDRTIAHTAAWYRAYADGGRAASLCESDYAAFVQEARAARAPWMHEDVGRGVE